jgi:hypothetical protein
MPPMPAPMISTRIISPLARQSAGLLQAHLIHTSDGPLLVRVVESTDFEVARRVFDASTHPIDAEHKAVLSDVLDGEQSTLLLLDIRR